MNNPKWVAQVAEVANVSFEEADEILTVVLEEQLVDTSEATIRELKMAYKEAQTYIRNGYSWV